MKKFVCVLLACAMLVLPACGKKQQVDERWPVEIDGYTFTKPAIRVISLSPSVTESLYMLGYGGRLKGISEFCDQPDSAKKLPRCGNALLPDTEKIKKLSPDLVFSSAKLSAHDRNAIEEAGAQLIVIDHPDSVNAMVENCRLIVTAFEGSEKAQLRVEEIESFIDVSLDYIADEVKEQLGDTETSAVILRKMSFTIATGDTLEGKLLSQLGFVNQAEPYTDWNYPLEKEPELNPDYIFCDESIDIETLQKSKYYKSTSSVTNGRVFEFDAQQFEKATPLMFFALEELMRDVFPDGFEEPKPNFVIDIEPPPEPELTWWEKLNKKFFG